MAMGPRVSLALVMILGLVALESGADGTGSSKRTKAQEIKLDMRPSEGRVHQFVEMSEDFAAPDTTADGLPGWLSGVPDSMRATISAADRAAYVRVYTDSKSGLITVSVVGPSGLVRRTTLSTDSGPVRSWMWDVHDSVRVRVPPGLYEVHARSSGALVIGYVVVKK
jgi:hypothetical protein